MIHHKRQSLESKIVCFLRCPKYSLCLILCTCQDSNITCSVRISRPSFLVTWENPFESCRKQNCLLSQVSKILALLDFVHLPGFEHYMFSADFPSLVPRDMGKSLRILSKAKLFAFSGVQNTRFA
jgi:hypothetical protein